MADNKPKSEKPKKERKRSRVVMLGEVGKVMQITLERKDPSTLLTYVTVVSKDPTGKKSKLRGVTETHTSQEAAQKAVDKIVEAAKKAGWQPREKGGLNKPKPDAFDLAHLPSAKK